MPSLGADMEAGTLVEWLVKPGDSVHRGDVVAVVETQKGAIEIEIFEDGTVQDLLADLGHSLPVGAPLATILAAGEAPPETSGERPAAPPDPAPAEAVPPAPPPEPTPVETPAKSPAPPQASAAPPPADGKRISPAARRRAAELGVDPGAIKGSGPGGAILLADVAHAAPGQRPAEGGPMAQMRKAIAAAMTRSKATIPHFYLSETINVDPAIRFLDDRNAGVPPAGRVLLGAVLVRAATLAAQRVPAMNGHYVEGSGFVPSDTVNTGVAIALRGGGLVAPALIDAGAMDLDATMAGMRDLVTRARAGRLRGSEMTAGTITVSSLGDTGAEAMTGVIFPPQVALVGLGAPHLRPWVVDGRIAPRHVVTLTLSADHRVSDGRQAARYIAAFEELVQTPEEL